MRKFIVISTLIFANLVGCSVNPVTGDRDLILVSSSSELQMGAQNYAPMQQSQGGTYNADPALTRYVQNVGNKLAAVSDNSLPYEFVVLNNSVPNAWALPGGKIAINRGLLTELNSEAELAAVLGHEVVHAAARHSAQQMSRGMLLQGLVIGTAIATSDSDYGNLAVGGANVAAQLLSMRYGRGAELESDKYGMKYMKNAGYDPQGAVMLQETFVRLSEGRNQDWLSGLFSSHPPSQERVAANIKTAKKWPGGGELGVDRYRAAMQQTMANKPAYDAYDEGRKALAEKQYDTALSLANKALGMYPAEAHFHALRGDVRLVGDKFDMAITNFNRAIDRDDSFFYYHLQRGIARNELGQTDAAITDLERSIAILPTAPAHYTLGGIAADRGNVPLAIEHYKVVAQGGGNYGKAATEKLVRLDMPSHPETYVASACGDDGSGNLIVSVRNETPVPVTNVQVGVQFIDSNGRERQGTQAVKGRLDPGQVKSVNTGATPKAGSRCAVQVVKARVAD